MKVFSWSLILVLSSLATFSSAFAPIVPTRGVSSSHLASTKKTLGRPLSVLTKEKTGVQEETAAINGELQQQQEEEELSETKKLMKQVKEAGLAGIISYALWEVGFWAVSVPVVLFGYREVTGHWPDLSNKEDIAKLGGEAFAFVNFARFAVPLRIGLALSTTPWIQSNVVDRFQKKGDVDESTD